MFFRKKIALSLLSSLYENKENFDYMKKEKILTNSARIIFFLLFCFSSCSDMQEMEQRNTKKRNCVGEYIYRRNDQFFFPIHSPQKREKKEYPWETVSYPLPTITKEFFRCKGSFHNPPCIEKNYRGEMKTYVDCGGSEKHGLPIFDKKEEVYPILIKILNFIQEKINKRVIVTCGHRCPKHNSYADHSQKNCFSLHMLGAEVDFYVQGMENQPQKIIDLIFQFYQEDPFCRGKKEYNNFFCSNERKDITTSPWYNKEIFITLFQEKEERDFDNRHPYPYISLQVRYDRIRKRDVSYTWDRAYNGYLLP